MILKGVKVGELPLELPTKFLLVSLLKMNSGQLGGDEQELAASPISRGSTLIAMMQIADLREGNNIACRGKLHATRPMSQLRPSNGLVEDVATKLEASVRANVV
jgi:hypothetical protein